MDRKVQIIERTNIEPPKKKRVAAYARLSLGTEHMLHSITPNGNLQACSPIVIKPAQRSPVPNTSGCFRTVGQVLLIW